MEGKNMRILCLSLLVLACSLFISTVEAGMGFSVDDKSTYTEGFPVMINGPSTVYYQQQPAVVYKGHESYQSCSCYKDECNTKYLGGFYKSHRQYEDDNG